MQSSITIETRHSLKLSEEGMAILSHLAKKARMSPEDYATKVLGDFLRGSLSLMGDEELGEMMMARVRRS